MVRPAALEQRQDRHVGLLRDGRKPGASRDDLAALPEGHHADEPGFDVYPSGSWAAWRRQEPWSAPATPGGLPANPNAAATPRRAGGWAGRCGVARRRDRPARRQHRRGGRLPFRDSRSRRRWASNGGSRVEREQLSDAASLKEALRRLRCGQLGRGGHQNRPVPHFTATCRAPAPNCWSARRPIAPGRPVEEGHRTSPSSPRSCGSSTTG